MSENRNLQTDQEFWAGLAFEMQCAEESALQFVGADISDHVFHDVSVNLDALDASIESKPVPSWGECFNW